MGSVDASASSEPPTVWNGCHGGDESVIPNQIPRFILQGVENRCQLCQCAGPVGRLDIGRAAESVCQLFQATAAEINTPGIQQSRRLMLRQHDGLPGGENHAELLPDLAARNQFSGSGGEVGKLRVDHHGYFLHPWRFRNKS